MAPESARIGDGMMEHKRAGVGKLSSDSSLSDSSDSNAENGLRWEKRDVGVGETMVCTGGNVDWGRGEVLLKEVKGSTRTVRGGVERVSSVPGKVGDGMANRGLGWGLVTTGMG